MYDVDTRGLVGEPLDFVEMIGDRARVAVAERNTDLVRKGKKLPPPRIRSRDEILADVTDLSKRRKGRPGS